MFIQSFLKHCQTSFKVVMEGQMYGQIAGHEYTGIVSLFFSYGIKNKG